MSDPSSRPDDRRPADRRPPDRHPPDRRPPWQPTPGWSERPDEVWGSDELDLEEHTRRPGPVALVVVVAIIVVAGAVLGVWVWQDSRADPGGGPTPGATPSTGTASPSPSPTGPPPVVAARGIERALTPLGFACYLTRRQPVLVRSCYAVVDSAAQTRVRIQVDGRGHVSAVRVAAAISQQNPGASAAAFGRVRAEVAARLGAGDLGRLSVKRSGRPDTTRLRWGELTTTLSRAAGVAEFVRGGAHVDRSPRRPLPVTPDRLVAHLRHTGYHCRKDHCTRTRDGVTARVDIAPLAVVVGVGEATASGAGPGAGRDVAAAGTRAASPVPTEQAMAVFTDVTRFTVHGAAADRAVSWLAGHRSTQFQHADFGGVHLQFLYRKGIRPSLALVSASGWH